MRFLVLAQSARLYRRTCALPLAPSDSLATIFSLNPMLLLGMELTSAPLHLFLRDLYSDWPTAAAASFNNSVHAVRHKFLFNSLVFKNSKLALLLNNNMVCLSKLANIRQILVAEDFLHQDWIASSQN